MSLDGSSSDPSTGNKRRAPTQEPSMGRKCVFPWWAPSSLSWLAGVLLVSGRWFAFLVAWSCLALSFSGDVPSTVLSSLSLCRGRRVPGPGGRGDGARRKGTDPRTGPFRYPSTNVEYVLNLKFAYMLTLAWWFSSRSSPSFFFFVLVVDFP